MEDRFQFRIPVFTDKDTFIEFEYIELGDSIDEPLAGRIGEPQQCTGLKDKNDKLIFEGDIVKDVFGVVFKVSFNDKLLSFVLEDKQNNIVSQLCFTLEVIGNIYEDPELLEANND